MTVYLFCYDIADSKRLHKVAKTLEKYGIRLQKSFFQLKATKDDKEFFKNQILLLLDLDKDRLDIYPVCEDCYKKIRVSGRGHLIRLEDFVVL